MKVKIFFVIIAIVMLMPAEIWCYQDTHIVMKWTYKYGEFPPRNYTDEIWIGENAAAIKGRSTTTIFRFNSDKVWIINTKGKKYYEQSIEEYLKKEVETNEKKETIHELGWEYNPSFEWKVKELNDKKIINNLNCRHYIAIGEADFSDIKIDLWMSDEVDIQHKTVLKDIIFKPVTRSEWGWNEAAIKLKELCSDFIISSTVINEPPIASKMTYIKTIDKIETIIVPAEIYELPKEVLKVNFLEDLF